MYLIRENFPAPDGKFSTFMMPDSKYFDENSSGFLPRKKENHFLYTTTTIEDITDEDLICIDVARESANRIGKVLKKEKR